MYIDFERPDVLVERLRVLPRNAGEQFLVLLADHHQGDLDQIVGAFAEARLPVFGAVFPGLIVGADWRGRGAIVQTFALLGDPLVADLSGASVTWLDTPPLVAEINAPVSALVFFDCLSPITGNFVTDLFRRYGNAMSYVGAGAANAQLENLPCIFAHGHIFPNAAIVALLRGESNVAIRHGWSRYKGPFLATSCMGNSLLELDWQPALDVYGSALPPELAQTPRERLLADVAPAYPLAVYSEGQEDVVRNPIRVTDDGALVFVSQVPENAQIYVVNSDPLRMLRAIRQSLDQIRLLPERVPRTCLTIECFSRMRYLGEHFSGELAFIAERVGEMVSGLTLEGVLSVGEIAGDGERALEIHNKAVVVDLIYG